MCVAELWASVESSKHGHDPNSSTEPVELCEGRAEQAGPGTAGFAFGVDFPVKAVKYLSLTVSLLK